MKLTRDGLLTALLVVAALFVGSFVSERMPNPGRVLAEQPFLHDTALGEAARLRTGEVTVTGVQSAKRIERFGQVAESAGVWLVFDLEREAVDEPRMLTGASLVVRAEDGREFGDLQAVISNCGPAQPGLPMACQIAIEVPADALVGAQLLIPAGGSVRASDDVAVVELGIDEAAASELAATEQQLPLHDATAVRR